VTGSNIDGEVGGAERRASESRLLARGRVVAAFVTVFTFGKSKSGGGGETLLGWISIIPSSSPSGVDGMAARWAIWWLLCCWGYGLD
jgi:hypothetical protein